MHVAELHDVPLPVARVITRAINAAGGAHVRLSPLDSRVVDIKFFDSDGLDIDTATERKIEGIFFREDYRRVYLDEIGRINEVEHINQIYTDMFLGALRPDAIASIARNFSGGDRLRQRQHVEFPPGHSAAAAN